MEITTSLVYWATRLDAIRIAAFSLVIFFGIFGSFATLMYFIFFMLSNSFGIVCKRAMKFTIPIFILSGLGLIFVPKTKEMAAIVIIPKVANSEKIDDIGKGMYNLAVEWMEELRPNKVMKND